MNDPDFDASWRAFAEEDARAQAPASVRVAVMVAWDAAASGDDTAIPSRGIDVVSVIAACATVILLVAAVSLTMREPSDRDQSMPSAHGTRRVPEPTSATAANTVTEVAIEPARQVANAMARRPSASVSTRRRPSAIVTLTADPAFETESLLVMRVRVPSASLEPFGIPRFESESSIVDVDVVVGEDGFPRDIRRIRPVVDQPARP